MNIKFIDFRRSEEMNYTGYDEHRGNNRSRRHEYRTPRCIQLHEGRSRCYWLMENGEIYRNGETSNGELGTGQTQGDRNGFQSSRFRR